MAMGVCTLVTAATAEVTRLNAPRGAPVASVGGYDSSSKPFCATVLRGRPPSIDLQRLGRPHAVAVSVLEGPQACVLACLVRQDT